MVRDGSRIQVMLRCDKHPDGVEVMNTIVIPEHDRIMLQRLEEELWIAETRFNRPYMETIMANDFFEFGRSGRTYVREEMLSSESNSIDAVIPLRNLNIRLITEDVAQVTYVSEVTYSGKLEVGNRSSIWSRKGEGWELRFHQGTAVPPD